MRTPWRKVYFNRIVKKKSRPRFDVNSLKDEYIRTNFVKKVDELWQLIENPNVTAKDCAKLVNILEFAAEQSLPNIVKTAEAYMWIMIHNFLLFSQKEISLTEINTN